MADWKQITARIRRARTSKDPASQLSNLFEKTRDAMVAFELAKYFETTGLHSDAVKWYATAAERFRRADWKTKAQEAAVRLGGAFPAASSDALGSTIPSGGGEDISPESPIEAAPAPGLPLEGSNPTFESTSASSLAQTEPATQPAAFVATDPKHRRRGRRGGRNRRKPVVSKGGAAPAVARTSTSVTSKRSLPPAVFDEALEPTPPRVPHTRAMPQFPMEPLAEPGGPSLKGRYGDPGLSSRISLLEMQFRRLLTCPAVKLDEADHAPVGPGVLLLTDSDLTSYYYVEACQTLRIAIGNLLRGGSSRRGVDSIKPQLAEHLGIPESRVPKYLAEHCVVRWLQLDEGASHFAHFVTAVLRPSLNE